MICRPCRRPGCEQQDVESCVTSPVTSPQATSPGTAVSAARSNASRAATVESQPTCQSGVSASPRKVGRGNGSPFGAISIATTFRSGFSAAHAQKAFGLAGHGRRFLLSIEFQVFITLAIVADVLTFSVETAIAHQIDEDSVPIWTSWISYVTLALYALEIILKLLCFSMHILCRDKWFLLDVVIVVVSAILISGPGSIVVVAKLGKVVFRSIRGLAKAGLLALRLKPMSQAAMNMVSKNKYRYVDLENNIDLDLSYISTDLVAMGVPTTGFANSFARNPLNEVARFFTLNHPDQFRVYNCCPEMPYPVQPFVDAGGSVTCIQIQDHTPPLMEQFVAFLQDAREFKSISSANTIAIHCKAGKGRTGSLSCAWLLYSRRRKTPEDALDLFARRRTDMRVKGKLRGVETPSQVRYVNQVFQHLQRTDSWLRSPGPPPPLPTPVAKLKFLSLEGGFFARPENLAPVRILVQFLGGAAPIAETVTEIGEIDPTVEVVPLGDVAVQGDIRVSIFKESSPGFSAHEAVLAAPENFNKAKGLLAYFCFHTGFMRSEQTTGDSGGAGADGTMRLGVMEIDKACKNVHTKNGKGLFGKDSYISLHFTGGHAPPPVSPAARSYCSTSPARSYGVPSPKSLGGRSPPALRVQTAAWSSGVCEAPSPSGGGGSKSPATIYEVGEPVSAVGGKYSGAADEVAGPPGRDRSGGTTWRALGQMLGNRTQDSSNSEPEAEELPSERHAAERPAAEAAPPAEHSEGCSAPSSSGPTAGADGRATEVAV
ncbi:unnamed protein product [Prorocentrum cordatum]|uniref:Phosphatidylinositol-3,4,5-trisphosphate 3-phosphatase n=1 Tax=Prorocentrum cordatum TaxID=2364126 RepID=A0ABN9WIP2_9DINO|nr:unnamed protein product [Polarella glacialis]